MRKRYSRFQFLLVVFVLVFGNVAYTNYVQHNSDAKHRQEQRARDAATKVARQQGLALFCAWLYPQVDPKLGEPTTKRGVNILNANRVLYEKIGCGKAP